MTFTFLKTNNTMVRGLYAESHSTPETPPIFRVRKTEIEINDGQVNFLGTFANVGELPPSAVVGDHFYIGSTLYEKTLTGISHSTKYSSIEENGDILYPLDLQYDKKVVYGEVQPADIVYGEPIVFAIGFVVSAK